MAQRQVLEGPYLFMLGTFAARMTSKMFPFRGGQHDLYLSTSGVEWWLLLLGRWLRMNSHQKLSPPQNVWQRITFVRIGVSLRTTVRQVNEEPVGGDCSGMQLSTVTGATDCHRYVWSNLYSISCRCSFGAVWGETIGDRSISIWSKPIITLFEGFIVLLPQFGSNSARIVLCSSMS